MPENLSEQNSGENEEGGDKSDEPKQNGEKGNRIIFEGDAALKILKAISDYQDSKDEKKSWLNKITDSLKKLEVWDIILTLVILAAQVVLLYRQNAIIKDDGTQSESIATFTKQEADAARDAAREAKTSTEIARKAFAVLDRPYVFVSEARTPLNLNTVAPVNVTLVFKNFGKTPAVRVVIDACIRQTNDRNFVDTSSCKEPKPQFYLASDGEDFENLESHFIISEAARSSIINKRRFLYFIGTAEYSEYQSDKKDTLKFCSTLVQGPNGIQAEFCKTYNSSN